MCPYQSSRMRVYDTCAKRARYAIVGDPLTLKRFLILTQTELPASVSEFALSIFIMLYY